MRSLSLAAVVLLCGCEEPAPVEVTDPTFSDTESTSSPSDTDDDPVGQDPPDGMCGDVSEWDLHVRGAVVDDGDDPIAGVDIQLVDYGWVPGTLMATATTDADGHYEFDVTELTSVEDCWGTLLDYVIVATLGDVVVEDGVNSQLYSAIVDGTLEVDLYTFPLVVE